MNSRRQHIPQDLEAERNVIAAVLLTDSRVPVDVLTGETGLRPEHFYAARHQSIWQAIVSLHDRQEPVDVTTVWQQIDHPDTRGARVEQAYLYGIPGTLPSAGHYRAYGQTVVDKAHFRGVRRVAFDLLDAASTGDRDRIAELEGLLTQQAPHRDLEVPFEDQQEELTAHFERGEVKTWRWPFRKLNELTGGLWPGHLTVLVGPSQHGKSLIADQVAEKLVEQNASVVAYLTEQTSFERNIRSIARRQDLSLHRLQLSRMRPDELPAVAEHVERLPREGFRIVRAGEFTNRPEELIRDMRRRRPDVAIVDLLSVVAGSEVKEIDNAMRLLAGFASSSGVHIFGTFHPNRAGFSSGVTYPPEPTVGSIRGSGQIHDLANNVLSIWIEEGKDAEGNLTGDPGDRAWLRVIKIKNGVKGRVRLDAELSRGRFTEALVADGTTGSRAA